MEKHLFTVFDVAAGSFLDPFVAPSVEYAIREFRRVVNQEGHQFNQFPQDYTLFYCGKFDVPSGKLEAIEPQSLGVAVTFLNRPQMYTDLDEAVGGEA